MTPMTLTSGDRSGSMVAVIMAGGQGQRFWPLSTPSRPKQFLDLKQRGRTLLQDSYDRVLPLTGSPARVMVATVAEYEQLVREQLPHLPQENLLLEPAPRDSGPAVALACLELAERFGEEAVVGFFSSDHSVGDPTAFRTAARAAAAVARSDDALVTIGVPPTRAATGYGYIQRGSSITVRGGGEERRAPAAYAVARFVEKPNQRTAELFLESGDHLWNAGIFVWRVGVALEELQRHEPDLMRSLTRAFRAGEVRELFPTLKRISIDFALMERTRRAAVVVGDFGWDDVGDWTALERLQSARGGAEPNTVVGRHVGVDASRNIIYTDGADDVIVTFGVHDLVIVKRGNTVMLVPKERVQEIKTLLADERMADLLAEVGA